MQKEKLSALMDGETLDNELLNELSRSSEMQKTWESYHLIRDTLRGDTAEVLQFDISARVMAAIENEPVRQTAPLIPESQPAPHQWRQMPFWNKVRPWASSLTQISVPSCLISYIKNPSRIPAATAEPITPATFGPIACISK